MYVCMYVTMYVCNMYVCINTNILTWLGVSVILFVSVNESILGTKCVAMERILNKANVSLLASSLWGWPVEQCFKAKQTKQLQ